MRMLVFGCGGVGGVIVGIIVVLALHRYFHI